MTIFNYSEEKWAVIDKAIFEMPDEFKLSASVYFSEVSLDEYWCLEFQRKYPKEYGEFWGKIYGEEWLSKYKSLV
jgi:hypothetical protein